ncbi:MAG: 3-deoxy-8-phosphooctulonate synthase [Chloroflexi bacterium]|nr:3-deoxy-8-phosphooctulonate synthase [Chloroflexota bacterium]
METSPSVFAYPPKFPFLVGGPCVIESAGHALYVADSIKDICERTGFSFIFKSSFDKANRSSSSSYRGPGLEYGLKILQRVREEVQVPVLSDIHEPGQAAQVEGMLDVIQIPALLARQTDLIQAAARTGRVLNLKRGQFMAPKDMKNACWKAEEAGCDRIILTDRGSCFGYRDIVLDLRAISELQKTGYPVAVDVSHTVQAPCGAGDKSTGRPEMIPAFARAAMAAGADGLFIEIHDMPEKALSDAGNQLRLSDLERLLAQCWKIHHIASDSPEYAGLP